MPTNNTGATMWYQVDANGCAHYSPQPWFFVGGNGFDTAGFAVGSVLSIYQSPSQGYQSYTCTCIRVCMYLDDDEWCDVRLLVCSFYRYSTNVYLLVTDAGSG